LARASHPRRITLRVVPRADRDVVEGVVGGVLRVRVTAAPADGAANDAVIRVLAAALQVPRSAIAIVRGSTSRTKLLEIDEAAAETVRSLWPGLVV
jgi:uncharacterized protein YggU (UPF0235/DUF167 family)